MNGIINPQRIRKSGFLNFIVKWLEKKHLLLQKNVRIEKDILNWTGL